MPSFCGNAVLEKILRESIKPQIAFLFFFAVAFKAVLLKDRFDLFLKVNRYQSRGRHCEQKNK
jgi:hypothetical protein